MGRFVARRLLQTIPVFIGTTFLIFSMVFALAGSPIRAQFGDRTPPPDLLERLEDEYGLNDPLIVQYGNYLGRTLQGDLGTDFNGRPVTDQLAQRIPVTVRLAIAAFTIQTILGLLAGVLAGLRRGSFADNLVLVTTVAVISIPIFVIGFAVRQLLGVEVGWFPATFSRDDGWQAYALPAFVLASTSLAYIARLTRTSLVENLRSDYVRTAKAKGLKRIRVTGVHAMRNSLIPVVTFLGADLGTLMGGAIVTEGIFNVPGVGSAVFRAISAQEGAVVVGIVTFLVFVYIIANLLVDILYAVLDPRIRYE